MPVTFFFESLTYFLLKQQNVVRKLSWKVGSDTWPLLLDYHDQLNEKKNTNIRADCLVLAMLC